MEKETLLRFGFCALLTGIGVYIASIGVGTGWHIAAKGFDAVFGSNSWPLWLSQCFINICLIALTILAIIGGILVAQNIYNKIAEITKRKPVIAMSAVLGFMALVFSEVCKDSLPGGDVWAKNAVKCGAAVVFVIAVWLFDSKFTRMRVAAVAFWLLFPAAVLLGQILGGNELVSNSSISPVMQGWIFASVWIFLAGLAYAFGLVARKEEALEAALRDREAALPEQELKEKADDFRKKAAAIVNEVEFGVLERQSMSLPQGAINHLEFWRQVYENRANTANES